MSKEINKICFKYGAKTPAEMKGRFIAESMLPPEDFVNIRTEFLKELDKIKSNSKQVEYIESLIGLFGDKEKEFLDSFPFVGGELRSLKNLQEKNIDDVYKEILNAPESLRAAKVAFVLYIKDSKKCRSEKIALNEANKIHEELIGKKVYKNKNSYDSSKSHVDMKLVYKILDRIK